jgi:hypothetical protein
MHPSRVGDVEHHQHAMTTSGLSLSAEPSAHYRLSERTGEIPRRCLTHFPTTEADPDIRLGPGGKVASAPGSEEEQTNGQEDEAAA